RHPPVSRRGGARGRATGALAPAAGRAPAHAAERHARPADRAAARAARNADAPGDVRSERGAAGHRRRVHPAHVRRDAGDRRAPRPRGRAEGPRALRLQRGRAGALLPLHHARHAPSPRRARLCARARTRAGGAHHGVLAGGLRAGGGEEAGAGVRAGTLTPRGGCGRAAPGNRRMAEAEEQLEGARARVWETRGRLLPATTGSGRYTWYTDPQTTRVVLPPGLLPAGTTPPAVIVRQAEFGVVNGTLRLPLDLSGELQHTLAAAQAGYRGERARLWATQLAEQVRVIRAYFQLLEAERLAEVTEQTIATDRQQLANAEQRFA